MANLFDNQFKKNPLSTTPAVGNFGGATLNVVSSGIGGGKPPPTAKVQKQSIASWPQSSAGQSFGWAPGITPGLSGSSASNVAQWFPASNAAGRLNTAEPEQFLPGGYSKNPYVPQHPITGIPGYPGYTGPASSGTAPVINTRTGQAIDPRTGKPVYNPGLAEIAPNVPTGVYNPPTAVPTGYPTGTPTGYPTGGTPTSYPSGNDLNQLTQTMAMMVAPQQSQSVIIGGDRSQLLPFQADRAFRGKDPGIANDKNRNYLDLLRAGFAS
jgi:hypothetical protein